MRKILSFTVAAIMIGCSASAQIKYKTNLIQKLGTNKAENEQMEGKLIRLEYEKGSNDDLVKLHWNYSVKNKTDKEIAAGKEGVMQLTVFTKKGEQYSFVNNIPALAASSTQLGEQTAEIEKDEVTSYKLEFKSAKAAKNEKDGEKKGMGNPIKKVFKKKDKAA